MSDAPRLSEALSAHLELPHSPDSGVKYSFERTIEAWRLLRLKFGARFEFFGTAPALVQASLHREG